VLEIAAPVPNNGTGFAPNFIPLALWIGVVVVGFMFHFRTIPQSLLRERRLSLLVGKLVLPASVVLGQAVVMLLMLTLILGVKPSNWWMLCATLLTASATFLAVIMLLVRIFGDAGKVLALILLILQLSSAGDGCLSDC